MDNKTTGKLDPGRLGKTGKNIKTTGSAREKVYEPIEKQQAAVRAVHDKHPRQAGHTNKA